MVLVLMLLMYYTRPRVVNRKVTRRWQALSRVGMMLRRQPVSKAAGGKQKIKSKRRLEVLWW